MVTLQAFPLYTQKFIKTFNTEMTFVTDCNE